jgi:hypothetical protein
MRRAIRALYVTGIIAVLAALGLPAAWAADDGMIRLAHLSPDSPSVDVYVDNVADPGARITLTGVGYGSVSPYQSLPPGTYTVSFRAAGADPASPPKLSTTADVGPGTARTVAGVGLFANLSLAVLDDDLSLPPAGSARVRVISAAATAPSVDVSVGGTTLASGLAMGKAGDYVDIPGGQTTLRITPQGSPPAEVPVTVDAGSVYSVLVLDQQGGGLTVTPVLDAASMPTVPAGGVETGAGGTAEAPVSAPVAVAVLVVLALLGTHLRRAGRSRPRHAAHR